VRGGPKTAGQSDKLGVGTCEVEMPQRRSAAPALHGRNTGSSAHPKQRAFVPFQGRILAEYYGGSTQGTLFDHPDELGSLTTATDYATSHSAERLFYPFGELWQGADLYSLNPHQTFGQLPDYDNDSGSDLYKTLNRHYTPMGRWLSPDPGGLEAVKLDDPQTWNMYAYVRNNPTTLVDPLGLQQVVVECSTNMKTCVGAQEKPQPPTDKPTTTAGTQKQEPGDTTAVGKTVYHEIGGLNPMTKTADGSAQDLHDARVDEAHVKMNRDKAGMKGGIAPPDPITKDDEAQPSYKDSQAAAREAATSPDRTAGATGAVVYYGGQGTQPWPGWIMKSHIQAIHGPFVNDGGGGDVPQAAVVLVFILKPDPK
jgi:RHS repeat-associated protein